MRIWGGAFRRDLAARLAILFLLGSLIPALAAGFLAYWLYRSSVLEHIYARLESTSELKRRGLESWIKSNENLLVYLAEDLLVDLRFRDSEGLLRADLMEDPEFHRVARGRLRRLQSSGQSFREICLLNREGRTVLSTDPDQEGKWQAQRPFFLAGLKSTFTQNAYHSVSLGGATMTSATPILDVGAEPLGVLAAHLNLMVLHEMIHQSSGRGETGANYLVNRYNYVVSPGKPFARISTAQGIYTTGVERALRGRSGRGRYRGAAGRNVLGVYRWLPRRELALMAEMEESEVFRSIFGIAIVVVGAVLTSLVVANLLFTFLFRRAFRPLGELTAAARALAAGDLAIRVAPRGTDQIATLSRGFNRMAADLQQMMAQLQESEEKYRCLFELAPEGIALTTADGRPVSCNPAFCRMFGYTQEQVLRLRNDDFYADPVRDRSEALARLQEEGTIQGFEFEARRSDGSTFRVLMSARRIEIGGQPGSEVVMRDLSYERRLEGRIKAQDQELRRMNRELQELNAELSGMVGILSHDLKTPLVALSGFAELLEQEQSSGFEPTARHCLQRIQANAGVLGRLVDGLIHYATKGTIPGEPEPIQLEEMVRMALERQAETIRDRKIHVEVEDRLGDARGPRTALQLALEHLLENSIKFMGAQRVPEVRVNGWLEGNLLNVSVRDNGIGIDPRYHEEIFDLFRRLDEVQDAEGTGAGLAVLRRVVRRLGGEIAVSSQPGRGSTFTVSLPSMRETP